MRTILDHLLHSSMFPMASILHLALFLILVSQASSDIASDRAECADQLVGLATCLPYVGGEAKSPTPDCCNGFKEVMAKSVKCLCVLIKDRNDPELGLKVDVKLALRLPSECNVPTNVSICPSLLKLDPNSKGAKEFQQFENVLEGKNRDVKANSTATSTTGAVPTSDGRKKDPCMVVCGLGLFYLICSWSSEARTLLKSFICHLCVN